METNKTYTQAEWEEKKARARREMIYVDIKPYSHNIIGLCMRGMSDNDAERFATELELGRIGWTDLDKGGDISAEDKRKNTFCYKLREKIMAFTENSDDENDDDDDDEEEEEEDD